MSVDNPPSHCSGNFLRPVSGPSLSQTLFNSATRTMGFPIASDFHEWAADCGLHIPHGRKRRARMAMIAQRGLLFIHVPKNAGTSIAMALYGRTMLHETMNFFMKTAPENVRNLPSIAILRDPVSRFISSYGYARAGGTAHRQVVDTFRDRYMAFRSVDDALDHVENARSIYRVDHIFRPQSWYVCGRQGDVLVENLIPMQAVSQLPHLFSQFRDLRIKRLNESRCGDVTLTARQKKRIETLYEQDFVLYEKSLAKYLPESK
ncbi:sulfotransferase family 2 domain-containing protein [Novacetimonas pomaceti]|nr:sulfotransferase family 2 domain-containing protein [Novacetimonas pomaceti]